MFLFPANAPTLVPRRARRVDRAEYGAIESVRERELFWQSLADMPLNERQRIMLQRLKGGFEGELTAAKWGKSCKVSPDTALRDINDLVRKGVLTRSAAGGRS